MAQFDEIWACADCLFYAANGDVPDERPDLEDDIQDCLGQPSGVLSCGDPEQDDEFSWRPCEACGSTLGGSRHQLFVRESRQ